GNSDPGPLPSPGLGGFMGAGSSAKPAKRDGDASMMFQLFPSVAGCLPQAGIFGHSFGTGGMSVALCDGSVRNIRGDMSPTTFARALCPADKQELGPDWADD
ncbi:MAG: H-X9-DG-CTERM domain-containing protein, partial [Planctomycetota bacterium]